MLSMVFKKHPFHLVDYSPWPLMGAIVGFSLTSGLLKWFHQSGGWLLFLSLVGVVLIMLQWWRDVIRESTFQGLHTGKVVKGMRLGMILFITSEVLFFFSFFWAYFHSSLSPTVELGGVWPPMGVISFNCFEIPLLNTIVLLSSGVTVTWAHHSIMEGDLESSKLGLLITIIFGFYFSVLQGMEYIEASFSIADSVYGSIFFVATGFHGLHVIIGSVFLFVCWKRLMALHYSPKRHFGFEAAAWYWHFVDVVWLFLYVSVYWWGGLN